MAVVGEVPVYLVAARVACWARYHVGDVVESSPGPVRDGYGGGSERWVL